MVMEFGTRGLARILDKTGIDFVLIDMEHSPFDHHQVADVIAWLQSTSIAPVVRVPQRLYHFIARLMDAGALGIMVANVETPEQAREIVKAVKFTPMGGRGIGLGTAHTDFVVPDPVSYFEEANGNTVVICQTESTTGLANADAIAATPGVDILWVGHMDLSSSLGIPGQFQHPRFLDAIRSVVEVTRRHGKAAGIQPGDERQAAQWIEIGYNVISWSTDISVYRDALTSAIRKLKER
jgi:2-dehydro-3-deoxyglucarate aldolase/4-hydroxy-2-oxoheptanedioate aldolase